MLTEEQLKEAEIELKRRANEKLIRRVPELSTVHDLERISIHEGTEAGEFWQSLCFLRKHTDFLSSNLIKALDKEINNVIKEIKKNYLEVVDQDRNTIGLEWKY